MFITNYDASYDHALAVVTSRAFSGMSVDGHDALVPLLDLLNHTRGSSSKNVGYKWNNVTNMVDVFTTVEVWDERQRTAVVFVWVLYSK